jgi:excisionase family DNA binding protein
MQNLVLIQVDELRQLIKEELAVTTLISEQPKPSTKPINQRELCTFLGLSEPTIIRWRKRGKIPFLQIGSAIRFDVNKVLEAIEVGKKKGVKPNG